MQTQLKLYRFRQTNSGGFFHYTEDLDKNVYIQATSTYEANGRAEELGIYFDGCRSGQDCNCCGDRWDEAEEYRAIESSEEFVERLKWDAEYMEANSIICIIHTIDGKRHIVTPKGVLTQFRNEIDTLTTHALLVDSLLS